jgi:hypothetical protein
MSDTFYNHRTGELSRFNAQTGQWTKGVVTYMDTPAPPTHLPRLADDGYQKDFSELASKALATANIGARVGFTLDQFRLDGFPGRGLVDGNFVMFVARRDKTGYVDHNGGRVPAHADYRYEMRAFDMIQRYENLGDDAVVDTLVRALRAIDARD